MFQKDLCSLCLCVAFSASHGQPGTAPGRTLPASPRGDVSGEAKVTSPSCSALQGQPGPRSGPKHRTRFMETDKTDRQTPLDTQYPAPSTPALVTCTGLPEAAQRQLCTSDPSFSPMIPCSLMSNHPRVLRVPGKGCGLNALRKAGDLGLALNHSGRLRQEDPNFKPNLGNLARPCLKSHQSACDLRISRH